MRALILVAFALLAAMPTVSSAQDEPSYYDQVVAQDDPTGVCDETGWSVLTSEITSRETATVSFMNEHAACINGDTGIALVSSCTVPLLRSMMKPGSGPDPGEAWVACTVMLMNGGIEGVLISQTDFSLVDSQGTAYPYTLAPSVQGGTEMLQDQVSVPLGDPVAGFVAFAVPETIEPPYLLVWEPGINGVALDPVWIVLDRLEQLPEEYT
jgi:hypothetical protein